MTAIDPLKIPAFMRRRRLLKDTSFQPSPKFKANPSILSAPSPKSPRKIKIQSAPFKPRQIPAASTFESPLFYEPALPQAQPQPTLLPVGAVTHYYDKIKVAVLKLSAPLVTGTKVQFMGEKGVFTQKISSMQINRADVPQAPQGADIGIKVKRKVMIGAIAYFIH